MPLPQISDDIGLWLPTRTVGTLRAHGIATLADRTVRIPRQRQWWKAIPGLGPASARKIESFFAAHPTLTERARALVAISPASGIVPWEQLRLPHEVDGSAVAYRAPGATCSRWRPDMPLIASLGEDGAACITSARLKVPARYFQVTQQTSGCSRTLSRLRPLNHPNGRHTLDS